MNKDDYRLRMIKDDSLWPIKNNSRVAFTKFYEITKKREIIITITNLLEKIAQQKKDN